MVGNPSWPSSFVILNHVELELGVVIVLLAMLDTVPVVLMLLYSVCLQQVIHHLAVLL